MLLGSKVCKLMFLPCLEFKRPPTPIPPISSTLVSGRESTHNFSETSPHSPSQQLQGPVPLKGHRAAGPAPLPPPPWASCTESQHELLGRGQRQDQCPKAMSRLIWRSKHRRTPWHPLEKLFPLVPEELQAPLLQTLPTWHTWCESSTHLSWTKPCFVAKCSRDTLQGGCPST